MWLLPTPTSWVGTLTALLVVRMVAATVSPIADCDETFNYWEPLHYILHHTGLQTWEYSAEFALRSYTYLWLHAGPSLLCKALGLSRATAFYATRAALGSVSALSETAFLQALGRRLGEDTRATTFWLLLSNAGIFFCSVAFVPSATCMTCVLVAMALFLDNRVRSALVVASFAVLLCWPFCVLLFVPLGVAALLSLGLVSVVAIAIGCVLLFLVIPSAMDSVLYYHKPVFPVANIVLYNAWGDSNADLYGTEPWYFYLTNLLLNFNVVALLALLSLPLWVIAQTCASTAPPPARDTAVPAKRTISGGRALAVVCFAPLYANLVFFSAQPHKEERFLFPLYPIICLAASVSVGSAAQVLQRLVTALGPRRLANSAARTHAVLQGVVVAVVVALSLSRIVAVSTGFSAPLSVFAQLSAHAEHAAAAPPVTQRDSQELPKLVCLGSEWYRFPTSFLLPENHLVGFVDSGFGGLLPQQFGEWPAGTSSAPVGLNGHNLPNPSALRRLSECDYFVDMGSDAWKALNRTMELEEDETSGGNEDDKAAGQSGWDQKPVWAQLECWPFLSVEHSRSPWRSFALPGWAVPQGALTLEPYCIFERRMTSIADD